MKYLGYDVCASTIRNILDAHGIIPDPERRRRGDWLQFIDTQQDVTAATDFAHAELATEYGLERRHLLAGLRPMQTCTLPAYAIL